MRISIIGWYGMNNVGDDAFQCVFRQFFRGHTLEFVTPGTNECKDPDLVILGGGAVVSPFYLNTIPNCDSLYALGVDIAYESEMDLLQKHKFKAIVVRNNTDIEKLTSKVGCAVFHKPDLAFYLSPSGSDVLSKYRNSNKKSKTIGVFVTDYVNPAIDRPVKDFATRSFNFQIKMAQVLDQLSEAGYEVVLVPCATGGYGDDRRINLDLAAYMKHSPTMIMDTLGPQRMIDLIADLDASICMRFHAHIFSMIAGTPFVSIEYTRKVKLFLQENNLTNCTCGTWSGNEFSTEGILDKITTLSHSGVTQQLIKSSEMYRHRLREFKELIHSEWLPQ